VFWALFDQHASTWVEQARQMDLTIPSVPLTVGYWALGATIALALYGGIWLMLWVSNAKPPRAATFGVLGLVAASGAVAGVMQFTGGTTTSLTLLPSQIQGLNPLMVMIIIPFLNLFVWQPLEKAGRPLRPLQRMTIGMFLAAAAFVAAGLVQAMIQVAGAGKVHVLWQVPQYFVMTTSEVLVSTEGLAFAYTQAPRRMKSTIMGFWLLNVTIGNLLVAGVSPLLKDVPLSWFFYLFAGLAFVATVVFAVAAYFYKGRTYLQQAK